MKKSKDKPLKAGERRALRTLGMWEDNSGRWRSEIGPLTPDEARDHAIQMARGVLWVLAGISIVNLSKKGR